jgi:histidyl-tRNA synthetase
MRLANRVNAQHVLIVGDDELKSGEYPLKRMRDGEQISVREAEIVSRLRQGWGD